MFAFYTKTIKSITRWKCLVAVVVVLLTGGHYAANFTSLNFRRNIGIVTEFFDTFNQQRSSHGNQALINNFKTQPRQRNHVHEDGPWELREPSNRSVKINQGGNDRMPSTYEIEHSTTQFRLRMKNGTTSTKQTEGKLVKVLLVAYFRGGSSFFGEVFNRNPEAIYWYEPLHGIVPGGLMPPEASSHGKARVDALSPITHDKEGVIIRHIKNLLQCKFEAIRKLRIRNSEKASIFHECKSGRAYCSQIWTQQCLMLKITAIKAIRMHLYLAERLWKLDPDIFIIHYVRDPRGMMLSRNALQKYENMTLEAERACKRIESNHHYALKFLRDYPTRFMEMRYEDLAINTTSFVNKLYKFLGSNVPESLLTWLHENTHKNKARRFGTARMSAATAIKWQTIIKEDDKANIDRVCSSILKQLGYKA